MAKSARFTCPRRGESFGPIATIGMKPGKEPDRYTAGHGLVKQARGCTYCGSMDPDDFLAGLREGVPLGTTGKNYKAYLGDVGKVYFQHFSPEQQEEFVRLYNAHAITFDGGFGFGGVLPYFCSPADKP